ncbi:MULTISPECIES: hypothetical protein [unclassified Duganella]|uniref:hypothetical protein n=1 Tax=unclassified Duganella TaxID=2636909 RepID=UPI0007000F8A|nr:MULTISPECIES: hypothetical protein [unclassified Duganella]KQV61345.1 hypothetical protein ASD07_00295 [Duganella sp. Root336D2]KRB92567.1 hypothetical protein ASE26_06285 [Duganella sp. Root198D2]
MKKLLIGATFAALSLPAFADTFSAIENQPLSELWVNPGFYSYHFQRDKGFDDTNPGFGAEYRFSTVASLTAGRFHNSDRQMSNYAGVYYQPWAIGPVRLGAVVGGFNGYPKMRDGGWFLAAIPVVSVEYQRVGVNFAIVPTYKERLHGALSVQLKFKLL